MSETRVVRLLANSLLVINRVAKATSYLEQKFEREPTYKELVDFLDLKEDLIADNEILNGETRSFDKPLTSDGEIGFCMYDVVEKDVVISPYGKLVDHSIRVNLGRAMEKLNKMEADIINLAFGLNE